MQRALKSSISQIGHKMTQAKVHEEMRRLHEKNDNRRNHLHDSIISFKEKQRSDLTTMKENIMEIKKT